jgi:hypothetical protein
MDTTFRTRVRRLSVVHRELLEVYDECYPNHDRDILNILEKLEAEINHYKGELN